MSATAGRSSRSRGEFRPFLERAALRPYVQQLVIDEAALEQAVKPLMAEGDRAMRRKRQQGMQHNEALLQASRWFSDKMGELCMAAVLARDQRAVKLVHEHGSEAIFALRTLGILDPPWLKWKRGEEKRVASQLAANLDETRPNREYQIRARVVRNQTSGSYGEQRLRPRDMASPAVEHVLSSADVAKLRSGECLVLDPNPALLPPAGFAAALADLLDIVRQQRGVAKSNNPCNLGSWHGMLPSNPNADNAAHLNAHTVELLRKLTALPALVERYGWHRSIVLPPMIQLGYYPGGSGARYRPHLDRWANEENNRRELTFLVYVNVGWQPKDGGCLRLHPDPNNPGTNTFDVEPLAGRLVIFESGKQMHEVLESSLGADRIALTLWVEYEEAWQKPDKDMMPSLTHS